jgi:hypothetical protein
VINLAVVEWALRRRSAVRARSTPTARSEAVPAVT